MTRLALERRQVWIYLAAILAGLALGTLFPGIAGVLDLLVWPVLAALLFATFLQVPMARLPAAAGDLRFMAAALGGNFLLLPLLVAALLWLLPDDPAVRLGVLLVLLVPCTDWFIAFAQLGRGDSARAIAIAPIHLALQLLLLPLYLWLFLGAELTAALDLPAVAAVFVGLILLPLAAAWLTQRLASASPKRGERIARLGWLPVPLLAAVVFLIAASQVEIVAQALPLLPQVLPAYLLFLAVAPLLAWGLARALALPQAAGRTLAFSFGTRNSFVVLPIALALPASQEAAVVVIVFQSLVELFAMPAYLKLVPRIPFRARA